MFKLLSPLVKDQTDQPSEPVSFVFVLLFFLERIALFFLCVYIQTIVPTYHIFPSIDRNFFHFSAGC